MRAFLKRWIAGFLVLAVICPAQNAAAYSVLTHEADVDAMWDSHIQPLLLARFPNSTPEDLIHARAYAYGGCIIQDMGYYPFGSHFFSDLVHYVRSGDFVEALLRDSTNADEYAFALGAVAHYAADNTGHPEAVNRSVALMYPKLREKFGDSVTYADAPKNHVMVEFSFDVVQVASGAYLPNNYHKFIGFQIAKPLLERAFHETYGIEMKRIFFSEDLALGTYRHGVSKTIPEMSKLAWKKKRKEIEQLRPGIERNDFVFHLSRRQYEAEFGKDYDKPHGFAAFIDFVYRLVPKIGPLRALTFKVPTPEAENLFLGSFKNARERYRVLLEQVAAGNLKFPNTDFDTGNPSERGEYTLADDTYADLLERLSDNEFSDVPEALRENILKFFDGYQAHRNPVSGDFRMTARIEKQLEGLRAKRLAGGGHEGEVDDPPTDAFDRVIPDQIEEGAALLAAWAPNVSELEVGLPHHPAQAAPAGPDRPTGTGGDHRWPNARTASSK